jgi:hypothetical protein
MKRDVPPMTAAEWDASHETWRMLHLALNSGVFTARKQLFYCLGLCRLRGGALPGDYLPILDDLEVFADIPGLPALQPGEQLANLHFRPAADRVTGVCDTHWKRLQTRASQVMDCRLKQLLRPGEVYYEGHPLFEADEGVFYATIGHVFGAGMPRTEEGNTAREAVEASLLRNLLGNPFRPVAFDPGWRTDTAVSLARRVYESRDFSLMPILADALQDAGCESADVLRHCREPGTHVRGCWVVDGVLGKE